MFRERHVPRIEFPRGHSALDLAYFRAVSPEIPQQMTPLRAAESLADFSNDLSGPRLTEIMSFYRKEGLAPDSTSFFLEPMLEARAVQIGNDGWGRFYMDTNRGLALGVRGPRSRETLWIGVAGIALGNELDRYEMPGDRAGRMSFPYQFPVIAQLQGPNRYTYEPRETPASGSRKYKKAVEVLSKYKWERAMIDIVLEWAQQQRVPAVYMLPGKLNHWASPRRAEQLRMRYDVSAERMGFRMQPNGLYGISLLSFPNSGG